MLNNDSTQVTDNLVATRQETSVTQQATEESLAVDAPHITPQKDNFALPGDDMEDEADKSQDNGLGSSKTKNKTAAFNGSKGI